MVDKRGSGTTKYVSGPGEFFDLLRVFMIRPWKVVVAGLLGAALMPCSALAAPTITITNPEAGKTYQKGDPVAIAYTCSSDAVSCVGTLPNGSPAPNGSMLDTSTIGPSYITVTARDDAGGTSIVQSAYTVGDTETGNPGGTTPPTLNLSLGAPTSFTPFIPGIAQDYTATVSAQLLSTAGDATLSVADP